MAAVAMPPPREEPRTTPFKFLEYYEERDEGAFAGRERDVAEISDRATTARSLVLYGKSGLGKTSVMLAGVFPALRARGYFPVHVRTLRDPLEDMAQQVRDTAPAPVSADVASEPAANRKDALLALLRRRSKAQPVVIVLDQFEEFFVRFRDQPETYATFVDTVGAILSERDLRVHVVFSLREEYLADLDDFRAKLPSLFDNEYRLRPMTAFGVREAITRPLVVAGIAFDTRLVSRLVDELATRRFDTVMLQILCQEVYEHAVRRGGSELELMADDLAGTGDVDAIFRRYLDAMTRDLKLEDHLRARIVLLALTTQERTKQAMRLVDFERTIFRLEPTEVSAILQILKTHRLVREDRRGGEAWYELTHERLVPILDRWLRHDSKFNLLVTAHDVIAVPARGNVWQEAYENLLPTGYLTEVIAPFKERLVLTADEVEFVFWSAVYRRHADVAFWASRHGNDRARALVVEKLKSSNAVFRRGAAHAAGIISRGREDTKLLLIGVALRDPDEDVRHEASAALHRVGGDHREATLFRALSSADLVERQNARTALADMYAAGSELEGCSLWVRARVRALALKRAHKQNRLLVTDAGMTALRWGLVGAAAWALTVGLVYAALLAGHLSGGSSDGMGSMFLLTWLVGLALALVFGAIVALTAGRALAVRGLMPHRTSWRRALSWSAGHRIVFWLWCVGWGLVLCLVLAAGSPPDASVVLVVSVLGVEWLLLPLMMPLAERSTSNGWGRTAVYAVLASAGMPVLVSILVFEALQPFFDAGATSNEGVVVAILIGCALLSGVASSAAMALGRVVHVHRASLVMDVEKRYGPPRSVVRRMIEALAILGLVCTVLEVGPGAIPVRLSTGSLTPSALPLHLPARLPERAGFTPVQYRRFTVDGAEDGLLVRIEDKPSDSLELDGKMVYSLPHFLELAPGRHLLSVSSHARDASAVLFPGPGIASSLKPIQITQETSRFTGKDAGWPIAYAWLSLSPDSANGSRSAGTTFLANISGNVIPPATGKTVEIQLADDLVVDFLAPAGFSVTASIACSADPPTAQSMDVVAAALWVELPHSSSPGAPCTAPIDDSGHFDVQVRATFSPALTITKPVRNLATLTVK